MRILFITPVIPTETNGRRPYNFIKYLGTRHQVHVLSLRLSSQTMDDAVRLAKFGAHAQSFSIGGLSSLASTFFSPLRGQPLRVAWCRNSKLASAIQRILERHTVDIIHFDRMRMGQYAMGLEGIPKLIDFTDSLTLYLERAAQYRTKFLERLMDGYESGVIPRYESKVLDHVDAALFCSSIDADVFLNMHQEAPVQVVPNCVDASQFQPKSRGSVIVPRLIMTGNLFYFPNVDAVQFFERDIWPRVRLRIKGIEAQVIGSQPKPEIMALHGRKQLTVIPNVKRMSDYLFQDDLFVCPLRVGAGVKNKVLEAMAAGMPVVTTPLGCEGLAVTPDEHLVVAETSIEFAEAIVQLVNNPDRRQILGQRARQFVEANHGLEAIGQHLEQVYNQVIAQAKSRLQDEQKNKPS